jgi:beta-galactosidase/beta-glucuronidase
MGRTLKKIKHRSVTAVEDILLNSNVTQKMIQWKILFDVQELLQEFPDLTVQKNGQMLRRKTVQAIQANKPYYEAPYEIDFSEIDLWLQDRPELYELVVQVGNSDRVRNQFGFRTIETRDAQFIQVLRNSVWHL